jgi:ABC-type uncharacterized transport system substrate-binding protein
MDGVKIIECVKVHLKNGTIIFARYDPDYYEDIYASWTVGAKHLVFENCSILTQEVVAIEWDFE